MRSCSFTGCDRRHYGRGLCRLHYNQAWTAGTLDAHPRQLAVPGASLDDRLRNRGWTIVTRGIWECWEWNGSRNAANYGQVAVGDARGRPMIASRAAYIAWVGPIPDGQSVLHRCDNPPCIRPVHLFLGTRAENNADMASKQRTLNGERRPQARLTDDQVERIRAAVATGETQGAVAAAFGISQAHVSMVVNRVRRAQPTYPPIAPVH